MTETTKKYLKSTLFILITFAVWIAYDLAREYFFVRKSAEDFIANLCFGFSFVLLYQGLFGKFNVKEVIRGILAVVIALISLYVLYRLFFPMLPLAMFKALGIFSIIFAALFIEQHRFKTPWYKMLIYAIIAGMIGYLFYR